MARARPETEVGQASIVPVILAGGAGSRLWPLSREQYPKQLIDVLGDSSLLQATVSRMRGFRCESGVCADSIIVCGDEHKFAIAEQLRELGVRSRIVVEPDRRDTAPALTLAALAAAAQKDDAIIVAMPADHAIADVDAFQKAIASAVRNAQAGHIVTLGIPPTRPETGFGYIRLGDKFQDGAHKILGFMEKPPVELAAQYLKSREYWWNSGIFVMRASVWLETLRRLQPKIYEACTAAYSQGATTSAYFAPDAEAFVQSPGDSIDYAVMEHLGSAADIAQGVVVPLDAGWSDLGSWDAVWDVLDKDENGNVARGRVVFEGTRSSIAYSEGRLIACVGVDDIVVVETPDAVLVANKSRVQEIKQLVGHIRDQHAPEADAHRKVRRPWGYYDAIDKGERFQVKRIVVQPGASLSLQVHYHRAEHWIVVSGTARVTRGEEQFLLGENESTYIPLGVMHRLENPGRMPLEMIEVQSGSYLGEDDIARFADTYGRG
ncbi:mannose-1-phosphate guanylyltransferase/mannose-6-phosphate isomerase [Paraburkholderia sp. J76]|uniref:mannose-1-phosphate guanylyltransferase/mannose-6-phosphate isomerase n=1 Tax=Paraburkholderia sp. J76 TaxID=2805439 RepID=UPI002ABDA473|nr:mannose-1-phosphate guanylyltransferase/mannose-6-phosphate isomerase [Paraburkholderia sp. J76]